MLEKVKMALRIKTTAFDSEIADLIQAALKDLEIAGVGNKNPDDPLISRAVITYCAVYLGPGDQMERMKAAYDEQKAQMQMATGYGLPAEKQP